MSKQRAFWPGVCRIALICSVVAAGAAGMQPAAERILMPGNPARKTPEFHPLSGRTIGILVGDAAALVAQEGRNGPPDALYFSGGGGSYRWVYVPFPEKPDLRSLRLAVGQTPGVFHEFHDLSMATPRTVRPKVSKPYTLVEVEVNGDRGSPATDRFVATKLELLDGTDEYPIKVADKVQELTNEARKQFKEKRFLARLEGVLAKEEQKIPKGVRLRGRLTTEWIYVTWEPELKRLRLDVHIRVTDGESRSGSGTEAVRRNRPGGVANPPALLPGSYHGKEFGVSAGVGFVVDKSGQELVPLRRMLPLEPFELTRPPPPGQREVQHPAFRRGESARVGLGIGPGR